MLWRNTRGRPLHAPAAFIHRGASQPSPSSRPRDRKQEDSHDRQSHLCHRSGGRFRNHLFHSVCKCISVRRKLERGGSDHPGPLRKHPVRPRNKRRSNLLCRWILRWWLPGTVGRACLPLRVYAGGRSGWPAHRKCRRTLPTVSGQRDLGRERAVRCLLRCLECRPHSKANVLPVNKRGGSATQAVISPWVGHSPIVEYLASDHLAPHLHTQDL